MSKVIVVIAILFFLISALYLPLSINNKFNTPDETANYFFAKLFAETGQLKVVEPLERLVDNAIHPRSVNVLAGFLVPEGFWGLPMIYGAIGRLFNVNFLPYLTAVLTILSLPFYFLFFKRFFGDKIARLSLLLLLVNPVFWYNVSRNFYHNVLFLNLVVVFIFLMSLSCRSDSMINKAPHRSSPQGGEGRVRGARLVVYIFAGLVLGLALLIRPAEAFWLAILIGIIFVYNIIKKNWEIFGLLFVLLPITLMLYVNNDLYGGPLRFGYSVTESTAIESQTAVPQLSRLGFIQQLILPFGFYPIEAVQRFFNYGIAPIWWFVLLMILGIVAMLFVGVRSVDIRYRHDRYRMSTNAYSYLFFWCVFSLYLILYYGGFNAEFFTDPGHEFIAGIGSPYLRYWLPVFIFATPFAAVGLEMFRSMIGEVRLRAPRSLTSFGMILFIFLSFRSVLWHGAESLLAVQKNLRRFNAITSVVMAKTPRDSVMIVPKWADRIYFSERKVIVDVEGKNVVKIIETLLEQRQPVFYLTGRGAIPLKAEDLITANLRLERRFDLDEKGKMYQFLIAN